MVYYALLGAMGVFAALTGYSANYLKFIYSTAALATFLLFAARAIAWLLVERPERPLSHAIDNARQISLQMLDRSALFFTSILFFVWLPPLKMMIPGVAGFFADPFLAPLDRAILGQDAWQLAHAVPFTPALDLLYALWPVSIMFCALWVAVTADQGTLRRFFLGWALCFWTLGFVLALMLASAGPIFGPELGYGFKELHPALNQAVHAMRIHDELWRIYSTNSVEIGGGISAAPSMHCALTFLFVLAVRTTWLIIPAIAYAALVWFGSVYLGWHYAVDGLISLIGVLVIWKLSERLDDTAPETVGEVLLTIWKPTPPVRDS